MRIAFLTPEFVTEDCFDGGFAYNLNFVVKGLAQRGHEVEVFVTSRRDGQLRLGNVLVHRVSSRSRWVPFLEREASRVFRRRWWECSESLSIAASLRDRLLRRHRRRPFELIHGTSLCSAGFLLGLYRPVPLVIWVPGDRQLWYTAYGSEPSWDRALACRLEVWLTRMCDAAHVPSRCLSRALRQRDGVALDVLPPAFELETVGWDERVYREACSASPYLLFFGTVGRLKGGCVLAEALATVLKDSPDLQFVFAGKDTPLAGSGGTMMDHVRKLAGPHANRIRHVGKLPRSQLHPIVARAHGVVLPSLIDNLPNACMEAMALRRVVIGTRGASFDELIENGESGLLVEIGDVQGLANAMIQLWRMPEGRRKEIGTAAHRRIDLLAPQRTIPCLEVYYQRVLDNWRSRLGWTTPLRYLATRVQGILDRHLNRKGSDSF